VQRAAAFFKVEPAQTLLVHDDIDLPFGKLRVKVGGGHGGHNGVRSVSSAVGEDTVRVRCGVGKPARQREIAAERVVVAHVLGGFSTEEQKELPFLVGGGADAVELVLAKGPIAAMNGVNAERPRS
jgi:PTH1 family peptidyl-tRNA hydrolase